MSSPSQPPASSTRFKLILDGALTEYQKKTKKNLLDYWLASELNSCESIDAVLDILQDQAKAIERTSAADQRLMNHIGSSVNVLASISDTLGEGISLVCAMKLIFAAILTYYSDVSTCESALCWDQCSPFCPYILSYFSETILILNLGGKGS